jgi:hypothetical protein
LTACCVRHNEASGGAQGGTDDAGSTMDAAGRHGTRTRRRRECITRRPRRTIGQLCCSDSPDDGCSLSHHGGEETAKRSGRQAGLRYSAGRAPGGRAGSSLVFTGRGSSAQERERGTGGLQADGPEASSQPRGQRDPPPGGTHIVGGRKEKRKTNNNSNTVGAEIRAPSQTYIIEIAKGIVRQPIGTGYGYSI